MNYLIIFVSIVLVFQIAMMLMIRYKKKNDRKNNILLKYDINSPKDAWDCLNDPKIPDDDKAKIQEYYTGAIGK